MRHADRTYVLHLPREAEAQHRLTGFFPPTVTASCAGARAPRYAETRRALVSCAPEWTAHRRMRRGETVGSALMEGRAQGAGSARRRSADCRQPSAQRLALPTVLGPTGSCGTEGCGLGGHTPSLLRSSSPPQASRAPSLHGRRLPCPRGAAAWQQLL